MTEIQNGELLSVIRKALEDDRRVLQEAENAKKSLGVGINWDVIYKVSQIAVFPALAVIFYMLTQLGNLDRRITITELVQASRPNFVAIAEKMAVFEERQRVDQLRMDVVEKLLESHRVKSTYDKTR